MSWFDIKIQVEGLNVPSDQFANALDLVSAGHDVPAPLSATLGSYDAGLSLHWADRELTVFADRYESYTFADGDTLINHWPHLPGQAVDPALLAILVAY